MQIYDYWSIDFIVSVYASIMSVYGPRLPHFEPSQLLNFYLDADPASALMRIRIRIQLFHSCADPDPASTNDADPDPIH